ncbi:DUF4235 domain-containing protein [Streptomyces sp. SL13]|uniref:DUF4235 domain-containing protein n=1 Tax=Streptantibioticus silvisoli TaxID=2705255 RepID=A0AA90H646_9ACTN|nr:DUF4235 domain-containing protein [Streptantibioticus silvisoli]MDI5965600.1 DUF4235 domain-containing protein [Streptantibioticus silvisoli]MDI5972621.1 DUF4235 domain-containing protein [Streptantibioticus silvisoli]
MKVLYKPFSVLFSLLGGVLAGMIFKRVWKAVGGEEEAPTPIDEDRRWREVLAAAALQGAIVAVVKAAANRGGASGVRRMTGVWPS